MAPHRACIPVESWVTADGHVDGLDLHHGRHVRHRSPQLHLFSSVAPLCPDRHSVPSARCRFRCCTAGRLGIAVTRGLGSAGETTDSQDRKRVTVRAEMWRATDCLGEYRPAREGKVGCSLTPRTCADMDGQVGSVAVAMLPYSDNGSWTNETEARRVPHSRSSPFRCGVRVLQRRSACRSVVAEYS